MSECSIARIAAERGYSVVDLEAALEADRRKRRLSHPAGKFDHAGVFHLAERCGCCADLRRPCVAYPHSEMLHGRSLTHIAHLFQVPVLHVRRLVKALEESRKFPQPTAHNQRQLDVILKKILLPLVLPARQ